VTSVGQVRDFDTIILAGGRASRMGGADKAVLAVGAAPMLVSVAQAAAAAGTSRLIVVGPARPGSVQDELEILAAGRTRWLTCVQEEPAGSGPVAGLRRGLAEAAAPWLVLLAADLPFVTGAHLTVLLSASGATEGDDQHEAPLGARSRTSADGSSGELGTAGVVPTDMAGRPQWLTSCWRIGPLRSALATYAGDSLHNVLATLQPAMIRLDARAGAPPPWLDCDTPADLATARRAWLARAEDPGD
jgi:molybdopterin-guanine dinucleotide biosynthesis protein A